MFLYQVHSKMLNQIQWKFLTMMKLQNPQRIQHNNNGKHAQTKQIETFIVS